MNLIYEVSNFGLISRLVSSFCVFLVRGIDLILRMVVGGGGIYLIKDSNVIES